MHCPTNIWSKLISIGILPVAAWKRNIYSNQVCLFVTLRQPHWGPASQTLDFVSDACCIAALLQGRLPTIEALMQDATVDQQL